MQFDELLVTTGVDSLVKLVKDKQKIELSLASEILKIPAMTIEEWAHILEEEGIIKIEYSLTKVYLEWIEPKPEQVQKEKESFEHQKREVQEEISMLSSELQPKISEVVNFRKSFDESYQKIKPRLTQIEKMLEELKSSKGGSSQKLVENSKSLSELRSRAEEVADQLNSTRSELASMKENLTTASPAKKKFDEIGKIKSYMDDLKSQMAELDRKIVQGSKASPPKDSLRREFTELSSEFGRLKENFRSLSQSQETFKDIDAALKERHGRVSDFKQEIESLYDSLEQIKVRSALMSEKLKNDIDFLENIDLSMDAARRSGKSTPDKSDLSKSLASIELKLKLIEEKLSKSSDSSATMEELKSLREEMEFKKENLEHEVDELIGAIEEESATYSTFQKIKEKALSSIEQYTQDLDKLSKEYAAISTESEKISKSMEGEVQKLQSGTDPKSVQKLIADIEELMEKKRTLDSISSALDNLLVSADSMTKKLNLLSKEANFIQIRSGRGAPPAEMEQKKEELTNQYTLTRDEQKTFDKKRQELRDLIKKLWEQS